MLQPLLREKQNAENASSGFAAYRDTSLLSPIVGQAQSYLESAMSAKPASYQSRYEKQIVGLYDQIMNRPVFSYDARRDPLARQYREQYIRSGQRAMEDSIGASAALTGGYGNSWAATAGYQAYGKYLQALNDQLPELEKRAREQYDAEGKALTTRLNLAMNMKDKGYGWYQDAMNDWQFNAGLAAAQTQFDRQAQTYRNAVLASQGGASNVKTARKASASKVQTALKKK